MTTRVTPAISELVKTDPLIGLYVLAVGNRPAGTLIAIRDSPASTVITVGELTEPAASLRFLTDVTGIADDPLETLLDCSSGP